MPDLATVEQYYEVLKLCAVHPKRSWCLSASKPVDAGLKQNLTAFLTSEKAARCNGEELIDELIDIFAVAEELSSKARAEVLLESLKLNGQGKWFLAYAGTADHDYLTPFRKFLAKNYRLASSIPVQSRASEFQAEDTRVSLDWRHDNTVGPTVSLITLQHK